MEWSRVSGMIWNGVEWSGMIWNGVEYCGMELIGDNWKRNGVE